MAVRMTAENAKRTTRLFRAAPDMELMYFWWQENAKLRPYDQNVWSSFSFDEMMLE
jgi:hypothetical protein